MTRTSIIAIAAATAFAAGAAQADCQDDIDTLKSEYQDFTDSLGPQDEDMTSVLENLRDATYALAEQGREEACGVVVEAFEEVLEIYEDERGTASASAAGAAGAGAGSAAGGSGDRQSRQADSGQSGQSGRSDQSGAGSQGQEMAMSGAASESGQSGQDGQTAQGSQSGRDGQRGQTGEMARQGGQDDRTAQSGQGQQGGQDDRTAQSGQGQQAGETGRDGQGGAASAMDGGAEGVPSGLVAWSESQAEAEGTDPVGMSIYTMKNEFVAEVDGRLPREGGKITHMVVGYGGFWDIGDKDVAVPADLMRFDPEAEVFYVPMSEDDFDQAPEYEPDDGAWDQAGNEAFFKKIRQQN